MSAAHGDSLAIQAYALALFNAAQGQKVTAKLLEQADAMIEIMEKSTALTSFLDGPQITKEKKRALVKKVFGRRLHKLMMNLLYIAIDRDRTSVLPHILAEFKEDAEREQGIRHARVTTARALKADEKKGMQQALNKHTGFKLILDYEVDASVIGGVLFRFGDELVDATVRHEIDNVRKRFMQRNWSAA